MSRARRRRAKKASRARRDPSETRLDLHLHTTRSDGRHAPADVLEQCAARGLHTIALTDHDVPPGVVAGDHTFGDRTLRVLHAAEVSVRHAEREYHLLAYFPGEMPERFKAFLRRRAQARADRYDNALDILGCHELPRADATARAGERALTRHHLARALVDSGRAGSIHAAFQGPLARRKGAVPPIELGARQALDTMRQAGAIPVWAHPGVDDALAHAATFKGWGLQGLEAMRPSLSGTNTARLERIALGLGLVVTGGSDWHGWSRRLGSFRVRSRAVQPFLDLLSACSPEDRKATSTSVDQTPAEAVDVA